MPYVDRTVFTTNDQQSGEVADPNKLEANDSHLADVVDANYTELSDFVNSENISRMGIVNVKDFGAKGDEIADDTLAIQDAIDDIVNNHEGMGTIVFPKGDYKITSKITSYRGILLKGVGGVTFNCSEVTDYAIYLTHGRVFSGMNPMIEDISFSGTSDGGFTTGLTCLQLEVNHAMLRNVSIGGFDKTTKFNSDTYILTFDSCHFDGNNYGIYFDNTSASNTGEKILFSDCIIGNNNYGIYRKGGNLSFVNCSIDYNTQNQVAGNFGNGTSYFNGMLIFNNCHLERTFSSDTQGIAFINNDYMIFDNCQIWEKDDKQVFQNNGSHCYTLFKGSVFRFNSSSYVATGVGFIMDNVYSANRSEPIRLNSNHLGIRNGDFETGDLSGWNVVSGTEGASVLADGTKSQEGSYSLAIQQESSSIASEIESTKARIHEGQRNCVLSGFIQNSSGSTMYTYVRFYDEEDSFISQNYASYASGDTSFNFFKQYQAIPNGAKKVAVRIKSDGSSFGYIDEIGFSIS